MLYDKRVPGDVVSGQQLGGSVVRSRHFYLIVLFIGLPLPYTLSQTDKKETDSMTNTDKLIQLVTDYPDLLDFALSLLTDPESAPAPPASAPRTV